MCCDVILFLFVCSCVAASIAACLLIVFGIVSPPGMVSATENMWTSSSQEQNSLCSCSGKWPCKEMSCVAACVLIYEVLE